MENNVKIFVSILAVLILALVGTAIYRAQNGDNAVNPGQYDAFAQCLKDSGAVFYGAYWCPNCQSQKKKFGSSAKLLPYVECSTLDGKGQLQACADKKIQGYPTWEFIDGSRLTGDTPLQMLADKTSCALPTGAENTEASGVGEASPAQ